MLFAENLVKNVASGNMRNSDERGLLKPSWREIFLFVTGILVFLSGLAPIVATLIVENQLIDANRHSIEDEQIRTAWRAWGFSRVFLLALLSGSVFMSFGAFSFTKRILLEQRKGSGGAEQKKGGNASL